VQLLCWCCNSNIFLEINHWICKTLAEPTCGSYRLNSLIFKMKRWGIMYRRIQQNIYLPMYMHGSFSIWLMDIVEHSPRRSIRVKYNFEEIAFTPLIYHLICNVFSIFQFINLPIPIYHVGCKFAMPPFC